MKHLVLGARDSNDRMEVVNEDIKELYRAFEGTLASQPRNNIKLALEEFNAKIGKIDRSELSMEW